MPIRGVGGALSSAPGQQDKIRGLHPPALTIRHQATLNTCTQTYLTRGEIMSSNVFSVAFTIFELLFRSYVFIYLWNYKTFCQKNVRNKSVLFPFVYAKLS